jgi:hypothetical protein
MTVSAIDARQAAPKRRTSPIALGGDRLVAFSEAAQRLGKSPDTLRRWHDEGHLPAVILLGQWSTFESFINAVLASARPGQAGVIEHVAAAWFAERDCAPGGSRVTGRADAMADKAMVLGELVLLRELLEWTELREVCLTAQWATLGRDPGLAIAAVAQENSGARIRGRGRAVTRSRARAVR